MAEYSARCLDYEVCSEGSAEAYASDVCEDACSTDGVSDSARGSAGDSVVAAVTDSAVAAGCGAAVGCYGDVSGVA